MRLGGSSERQSPRIAGQVRVLEDEAQATVVRVFPESLVETEGAFLNAAVLAARRTFVTVADQRVLVGIVDGNVLADVVAAVVRKQQGVFRLVFETIGGR